MKKIFIILFLTSISLFAQITITNSDFSKMFTVGNEITIRENEGGGAVNIGAPGINNTWDFTFFQGNLQLDMISINPATSPYISEFPEANVSTYSVGDFEGDQAELWNYSSLNGSFDNYGFAALLSSQPGDLLAIKHNPARIEAELPLTINSSWSHSYTQTLYINGSPFITSQITYSVNVDAYGTMILPGGESYEALRMRETMTINGMTSVTYQFLSKSGAQASVYAAGANPPDSGLISTEGYSWNSEFSGSGSGFVLTYPGPANIMIAGELDSVLYGDHQGEVDLYYSTDEGLNYTLIESGYSSNDGVYYWEVPESLLTTKAKIRVTDVQDTTKSIFSDLFKIKPWQFTRIDANDNFELYEPDQDGWSFCNCGFNQWPTNWWQQFDYQNGTDPYTNMTYPQSSPFSTALRSDFPDWELFVDVFSQDSVYIEADNSLSYRSRATSFWGNNKGRWGGSCAGFSVTSLMSFYYGGYLAQYIGPFNDLFMEMLDDDSRYVINVFQTHQYGKGARNFRRIGFQKSPRVLLAELKEMLGKESGDSRTLDYYNNNGSGGHAVVPYKLERIGNSSAFNIRLYNPNNPGSFNQFIYIDSVANTWSDSTNLGWGTGSSGCFLEREVFDFLSTPSYTNFDYGVATENSRGGMRLTVFNTPDAEMIITSENGEQAGYQDSLAFSNIPDAFPIIPLTGGFHPPIGYDLPESRFSFQLDNFSESESYILFETDLTMYDYTRYGVNNNESDLFRYDEDGIKIINPDGVMKEIDLKTIILESASSEKVFITNNIELTEGDSVNISEKDRNELTFNNYGTGTNYNLRIIGLSENGEFIFEHSDLTLGENTGHQLVPDWNDLENQPLKILIDIGNDGIIDDSIFVNNQSTDVKDEGSLLSPDSYNLAQNYPNPFNPVTTIKYSIQENGHVSLKVYDILGKEVASLVNEEKTRGVYSVIFDASNLSSGIYFYKIQAGSFVETKKMLLIK